MRGSFLLLGSILTLPPAGVYAQAENGHSWGMYPSLTISTPICIDPRRARESDLARVNYRDCIPLLNEILLDPNINHQNLYNATNAYQGHFFGTCTIALLPRPLGGTDVFWGYEIAIAAATAIKNCVEDSEDQYGGLAFTISRLVFYTQVKNQRGVSTVEGYSTAPSVDTDSLEHFLLPANNTNAALLATATPTCQISQSLDQRLYPIRILDCYNLFYNLLVNPTIERPLKLRGLYPIRYESFGTCTLQLYGHSLKSADMIKYIEIVLAAVNVVQTCLVRSGLVLGGAVGVGSRGQYLARLYNPLEGAIGDTVQSE